MPGNDPTMYQRARKEGGLTQEQAAERLHVSETTIKAWEQGQRAPDNAAVAHMAALYDTPWLLLEHAAAAAEALGVLPEDRPCAVAQAIGREGENRRFFTLGQLKDAQVDMFCTVFIGNGATRMIGGNMVTPRGYRDV